MRVLLSLPQWLRYFLVLFSMLVTIEVGIRVYEKPIASLQDGALIKLQMFALRNKTDLLLLGTSRTQDGIDPSLIAALRWGGGATALMARQPAALWLA